MLKLALVRPPDTWGEISDFILHAPVNLMILAAYIRSRHSASVEIWDYCVDPLTRELLTERLTRFKPDLLGFTATTSQIKTVGKMAALAKQVDEDIVTIAGGSHVTFIPERTLDEFPGLDIIVRHEGEETLLDLCRHVDNGLPLDAIPGITYRRKNGITHTPRRPEIADLDTIPFPARDLVDWSKYQTGVTTPGIRRDEMAAKTLFCSRGCEYACIFCPAARMNEGVRFRSLDNIEREVVECIENYETRHFTIKDCMFNRDDQFVRGLCDIFSRHGVTWDCNAKVNHMTPDLMRRMAAAGCRKMLIGVESASPRLLQLIKKGQTIDQVEAFCAEARRNKITLSAYFMIGSHPSETLAEARDTLRWARTLDPEFFGYSMLVPFPGTELWNLMESSGYILDIDWDNHVLMTDNPTWRTEHFSPRQLLELQQHALAKLHLRPSYIWNKLKMIHRPSDALFFIRAGAGLLHMVARQHRRLDKVRDGRGGRRPRTVKRGLLTDDL
ncbi:cobalamin-dependent protein [bacterium]|nr:cobalamin-dependent protein [candidate division CSSED10-310 bacterium]